LVAISQRPDLLVVEVCACRGDDEATVFFDQVAAGDRFDSKASSVDDDLHGSRPPAETITQRRGDDEPCCPVNGRSHPITLPIVLAQPSYLAAVAS